MTSHMQANTDSFPQEAAVFDALIHLGSQAWVLRLSLLWAGGVAQVGALSQFSAKFEQVQAE